MGSPAVETRGGLSTREKGVGPENMNIHGYCSSAIGSANQHDRASPSGIRSEGLVAGDALEIFAATGGVADVVGKGVLEAEVEGVDGGVDV